MQTRIISHVYKHAEWYAREVLHLEKSKWKHIESVYRLDGLLSREKLILLHAPRYKPTEREIVEQIHILHFCKAKGLDVEEVILP